MTTFQKKTPAIKREELLKHERLGEGGTQPFADIFYIDLKKKQGLTS